MILVKHRECSLYLDQEFPPNSPTVTSWHQSTHSIWKYLPSCKSSQQCSGWRMMTASFIPSCSSASSSSLLRSAPTEIISSSSQPGHTSQASNFIYKPCQGAVKMMSRCIYPMCDIYLFDRNIAQQTFWIDSLKISSCFKDGHFILCNIDIYIWNISRPSVMCFEWNCRGSFPGRLSAELLLVPGIMWVLCSPLNKGVSVLMHSLNIFGNNGNIY